MIPGVIDALGMLRQVPGTPGRCGAPTSAQVNVTVSSGRGPRLPAIAVTPGLLLDAQFEVPASAELPDTACRDIDHVQAPGSIGREIGPVQDGQFPTGGVAAGVREDVVPLEVGRELRTARESVCSRQQERCICIEGDHEVCRFRSGASPLFSGVSCRRCVAFGMATSCRASSWP